MMVYIPDSLYIDIDNKDDVTEILKSVPETSLHFEDQKTLTDAIEEIRDIGEDKIADFLIS